MKRAPAKKPLPPPRVRREPPTLAEAVLAAQGLSTEVDEQIEIAAGLMSVPEEEVRPLVLSLARERSITPTRPAVTSASGRRVVVVERRRSFSRAG